MELFATHENKPVRVQEGGASSPKFGLRERSQSSFMWGGKIGVALLNGMF